MGDRLKGCVVVHGLSGTPGTMRPIVDLLCERGYLVDAPLLPGHGTSPEDLVNVRWEDWYSAVRDSYFEMRRKTERVSVAGISLGSLLSLMLAEEMRWGVRSVVSLATPLVLDSLIERMAYPLVKYTPVRWFYKFSKKNWEKSVLDPGGRRLYKDSSYDRLAVHSVMEIFELKRRVLKNLYRITSPILVVHGRYDTVAPMKNVELIKKSAGSNMVEVLRLERSAHVVTLDYERDRAAQESVAFLERFS